MALTRSAPADAARRIEALLGAPLDRANPYGLSVLAGADPAGLPPAPAEVAAELLAAADGGRYTGGDRLARVLRPVFGRDLALGRRWAVQPLLAAGSGGGAELAALLGAAGLVAAAGGVLRSAVRTVDERGRQDRELRQWQPILADAFADLLACESLTAVALRALPGPAEEVSVLVAAVGCAVPQLVGEVLDALELVLNETGFGARQVERRRLAKLMVDQAGARSGRAFGDDGRLRLVRAVGGAVVGSGELFRLAAPPAGEAGPPCHLVVAAALDAAAARRAAGPAAADLARSARRLVTERRAVHARCRAAAQAGPGDPVVRALADRQALLLLAGAVLGVTAAAGRDGFLGRPEWALLALVRIIGRLGVPLPGNGTDPREAVWTELAERNRWGLDCDVHGTELLW
ncbi:hypothetical protein ACFYNO_29270 [Kitasatospora sp. NPDC006697]|uniref:hypothetical protein n=1 Tax=Kitasatospora sp. NPDC006697 TaxID=3364020 RepID=UPI00368D475D